MNSLKKRLLLIVLILIISITGCSQNSTDEETQQNIETTETNVEIDSLPAEEYIYPDIDGEGTDFRVLNSTTEWGFYTNLVLDEMTGDILDDAIYIRNRFIEDKFNINIKEIPVNIDSTADQLRRSITAGDDEYDAAFCPAFSAVPIGTLIVGNFFYNQKDIPTLNFEKNWWNQTMNKEAAIGKGEKLYYSGSEINIMALQTVACLFFNQDMMINLGLDLPYNAVREGKWTLELFDQYLKSAANLNGDESFNWTANGHATYGFTAMENSVAALVAGFGECIIKTDSDGNPYLAIDTEQFVNAANKAAEILYDKSKFLPTDRAVECIYEAEFMKGRTLMIIDELRGADIFRDLDATFGLLPMPKYNENQENYYCLPIFQTPVLVIPSTNSRPDFTGIILDAWAYVSSVDVTPVFFDVAVSQKQLRNQDSIDMLQIMKNSGSFEVGCAYGWTTEFYNDFRNTLGAAKEYNIVSKIESAKDGIAIRIVDTMQFFDEE